MKIILNKIYLLHVRFEIDMFILYNLYVTIFSNFYIKIATTNLPFSTETLNGAVATRLIGW